jgi:ribonuclease VapC
MIVVIDSSALVAHLLREPETVIIAERMREARERLVGAVSYLETTMVVEARKGLMGRAALGTLIQEARLKVVPFDLDQMRGACGAFRRFGKGRHPAALNMGDCATYALVASGDHKLLCKGNDFALTDLASRIIPLDRPHSQTTQ